MNILTRKENIFKNNIITSAMNIEVRDSFLIDTFTIFITILLDDLKKINYWTIPAIYLKEYTKDYKLACKYVELVKMEILEVPKGKSIGVIKVARLTYVGDLDRQRLYNTVSDRGVCDFICNNEHLTIKNISTHYM